MVKQDLVQYRQTFALQPALRSAQTARLGSRLNHQGNKYEMPLATAEHSRLAAMPG